MKLLFAFIFSFNACLAQDNWIYENYNYDSHIKTIESYDNGFVSHVVKFFPEVGPPVNAIDFLIKIDQMGEIVWEFELDKYPNGDFGIWDFSELPNGDLILGGMTNYYEEINPTYKFDPFLIRLDACGDTIWYKKLGIPNNFENLIRLVTIGENIFAIIQNQDSSLDQKRIAITKFNGEGEEVWTKIVYENRDPEIYSFIKTSDNGFLITGDDYYPPYFDQSSTIGYMRGFIIKIDSTGEEQWTNIHRWEEDTAPEDIFASKSALSMELTDSSYTTIGHRAGVENNPWFMYKTDKDGNTIWYKTIDSVGINAATNMTILSDSTFLISNNNDGELHLHIMDTSANIISTFIHPDTISEYGWIKSMIRTNSGMVFIAPSWKTPNSHLEFFKFNTEIMQLDTFPIIDTLSYDYLCTSGVIDHEIQVPISTVGIDEIIGGNLFTVYPNPGYSFVNIKTGDHKDWQINFIDLSGRMLDSYYFSGKEFQMNLSSYNPGLYFIELISDKEQARKKIILK